MSEAFRREQKVLLTGGATVIGSGLVPYLIQNQFKVYLLLRANSREELTERFQKMIAFWGLPPYNLSESEIRNKITPIAGSVRLPKFGLSEDVYQQMCRELSHVVHAAMAVRVNMTKDEVDLYCVIPTYHVCELLSDARKTGNDIKLEYISTIGVGGKLKGSIEERVLEEKRVYHNVYESGRARAEAIISEGLQRGFHITIHRPSIVIGHSLTGTINRFQVFYQICEYLTGKYSFGLLPRLKNFAVDAVPVDYVAQCILWSMQDPKSSGEVLHICAGPQKALSITDLRKIVHGCWHGKLQPILLPDQIFLNVIRLLIFFAPPEVRKRVKVLPYYLKYIHETQVFENRKTTMLTSTKGIQLPEGLNHVKASIDFYLANTLSHRK